MIPDFVIKAADKGRAERAAADAEGQSKRRLSSLVRAISEGVLRPPRNWRPYASRLVSVAWIENDELRHAKTEGFWWKQNINSISVCAPIPADADVLVHWEL